MVAMLRPGGYLLMTVPAFMTLWDRHDEINHHFRRYDCNQVRKLLAGHGRVREVRYLFHGLFFLKGAFKLVNRISGGGLRQESVPPQPVNRVMQSLCLAEYFALRRLHLPFGTSVLAVVERSEH
jgi:hypothetical protein